MTSTIFIYVYKNNYYYNFKTYSCVPDDRFLCLSASCVQTLCIPYPHLTRTEYLIIINSDKLYMNKLNGNWLFFVTFWPNETCLDDDSKKNIYIFFANCFVLLKKILNHSFHTNTHTYMIHFTYFILFMVPSENKNQLFHHNKCLICVSLTNVCVI